MTKRLYLVHDEVGMAVIAASNPKQALQMATWDWGHCEPVLLGYAIEEQEKPELVAEAIVDKRSDKRWRGKKLLERMWDELDVVYDRIMSLHEEEKPSKKELADAQGYARGLAWCIMNIESPYLPDINAVREKAQDRWEERNG